MTGRQDTVTTITVARLENPDVDTFLRDYVETRTPAVLCGTKVRDQFQGDWDAESVAAWLGERQFQFKRSSSNAHPNFRATSASEMFAREKLTFAEFFSRIARAPEPERSRLLFTGDEHYVARMSNGTWSVNPELEPLWPALDVPRYVPRAQVYSIWSWFSGAGAFTWLHYDNNGCHNLNVQLHGEKRCVLFSPEVAGELDLFEPGQPVPAYNCSRIDLESPLGIAKMSTLDHFDATIFAGDLLYIPPHWLHAFWHRGVYNANVNFWWKPLPHEQPGVDDNPIGRREARLNTHKGH